jgi:hypothetical protein
MFEWSSNLKTVTDEFLRILLGANGTTNWLHEPPTLVIYRFVGARKTFLQ